MLVLGILTGDESWFDLSYDYEGKWALTRDPSMMKPKVLINTSKIMVLVIWVINGPALVELVQPNLRVNAKYLCEFVIPHMEANVKMHRPKQGLKGIAFHWDNVSSHTANVTIAKISELRMNQMPHLPSSPEIAPNYFFLFGYLKRKLSGCSYDSADELLSAITYPIENLEKSLFHRVFNEWISHLHLVVDSDRDYIQTSQKTFATHAVA
jgi:hypothetical protein